VDLYSYPNLCEFLFIYINRMSQVNQLAQTLAQILVAPNTLGLSHQELVDAKQLCVCPSVGTVFGSYNDYMRAKRAKITGVCCNAPPGTLTH